MRMNSVGDELIRKAKIVILNETTKALNNALIDYFRRSCKTITLWGILLLGEYFRQILLVVLQERRSAIVEASIKFNNLWGKFEILKLANNVRSVDQAFIDWLIQLGKK